MLTDTIYNHHGRRVGHIDESPMGTHDIYIAGVCVCNSKRRDDALGWCFIRDLDCQSEAEIREFEKRASDAEDAHLDYYFEQTQARAARAEAEHEEMVKRDVERAKARAAELRRAPAIGHCH